MISHWFLLGACEWILYTLNPNWKTQELFGIQGLGGDLLRELIVLRSTDGGHLKFFSV